MNLEVRSNNTIDKLLLSKLLRSMVWTDAVTASREHASEHHSKAFCACNVLRTFCSCNSEPRRSTSTFTAQTLRSSQCQYAEAQTIIESKQASIQVLEMRQRKLAFICKRQCQRKICMQCRCRATSKTKFFAKCLRSMV